MFMFKRGAVLILLAGLAQTLYSQQGTMELGVPVSEEDLAGFDLIAPPDGTGYPPGSGTPRAGRQVYNARCAACHGLEGEGVTGNTVIAGGDMQSDSAPLRTVGSYWPHVSTLFDFVRRAMPADAPKSLSDDEVYQVIAYVLYLNGIVSEDSVIDGDSLGRIVMPNAAGFVDRSDIQ